VSADADRIARQCKENWDALQAELADHERTKAELTAERADRLNIDEHRGRLMRERDAALDEIERLRGALHEINAGWSCSCYPRPGECPTCIARAALGES
jgi:rubrerythrin